MLRITRINADERGWERAALGRWLLAFHQKQKAEAQELIAEQHRIWQGLLTMSGLHGALCISSHGLHLCHSGFSPDIQTGNSVRA